MNIHYAMDIDIHAEVGIFPQKQAYTCCLVTFFWKFHKRENHKVVVLLQLTVHTLYL